MKIWAVSLSVVAFCVAVALCTAGSSSASMAPLQEPAWGTAAPVFEDAAVVVGKPEVAQDSLGNVHAIWYFSQSAAPSDFGIMYAARDLAGAWSTPEILPKAGSGAIKDPTLLVGSDDTLHVLWTAHNPDTYTAYTYRPAGGDWQTPELLPYGREDVNARLAPDGALHLMDRYSNTHLWLPAGGSWLTETVSLNVRDFEIDSQNAIHAIGSQATVLAYGYKAPSASWVTVSTTYAQAAYPEIAVDPEDGVHVAWLTEVEYPCEPQVCTRYDLRYARVESGSLTSIVDVDSLGLAENSPLQLEAAENGIAHLLWQDIPLSGEVVSDTIRYAERLGDGSWGLADSRTGDLGRLAVAWNGDVHLVWRDTSLNHQWREPGSAWSETYYPDTGAFDISWANGFDVSPGNPAAPGSLHSLHLLFAATNMAVYNDFSLANATEPLPAVADFSAAPVRGIAPLGVAFDNLSSGDFATCLWEFGDGDSSTGCNDPIHIYGSPGTYDVSLTVSGAGGSDTEAKADYVAVFYGFYLPLVVANGP